MNKPQKKETIAVVGVGITGIVAAIELAKSGQFDVKLFEKENQIGGLSSFYQWKDIICDRFYHVILPDDTFLLDFIKELNLESELRWRKVKSGFFGRGKLVPFASAGDFLRFPFLSLFQKLRLSIGILYSVWIKNPVKLDNIYAHRWLRKVFGKKVYENFWKPLLKSKLGKATNKTSAAYIWSTIHRLYGARKSATKQEKMGHIRGGYFAIIEAAKKKLSELGVKVLTESHVTHLGSSESADKALGLAVGSKIYHFDKVLLTIPYPNVFRILSDIPQDSYFQKLRRIEYLGVICVLFILNRGLSSYYVINLIEKALPFTGVIESTNILSSEELKGKHLVYLPRYVTQDDFFNSLQDDEITNLFIEKLSTIFPEFKKEDILHAKVFRERYVQPILGLNFLDSDIHYQTSLPNIYLANTAMIFDSTLNNNAAIGLAQSAAQAIIEDRTLEDTETEI